MDSITVGTATVTLPALVGTPKQIAYAEALRESAIRTYLTDLLPRVTNEAAFAAGGAKMSASLASKTDAAVWIEIARTMEAFIDGDRFYRAAEYVKAVAR